ncbi:MAG: RQC-minor-1 family DNA-binding protein [Pseudomonadota bacterium]|nr:RQC-minor-1 family DNA-binding protein [Pseudomonadota bacterium]
MRPQRQPFHLHRDPNLASLPIEDIRAILRAADPLIATGGRTLLTKILKGSRAKDVLVHGLHTNPCHGYYQHLTPEEVLARIDWTILNGYMQVEYAGQLPVLTYTPLGWSIEMEVFADEVVRGFDALLAGTARPYDLLYLKDRHRGMVLRILEKVQESGDRKYVPLLEDWAQLDYKKVQQEIRKVIRSLIDRSAP